MNPGNRSNTGLATKKMPLKKKHKSRKFRAWEIIEPMFGLNVRLLMGGDLHELKGFLDKHHTKGYQLLNNGESSDEDFRRDALGMEFYVEDRGEPTFYVWVEEPRIDVLSHELLHMTFEILYYIGFKPSPDSEEAYTYLFDGLMRKATDTLFKIEPKHKV